MFMQIVDDFANPVEREVIGINSKGASSVHVVWDDGEDKNEGDIELNTNISPHGLERDLCSRIVRNDACNIDIVWRQR